MSDPESKFLILIMYCHYKKLYVGDNKYYGRIQKDMDNSSIIDIDW